MTEIGFIYVLFRGDSHYGKHWDCKNRKSYYVSIIWFFKGRMLLNDISYNVCIVISKNLPPDSDFETLFRAEDWGKFYGQRSFSEVEKVKCFFFSELIFN